MHPRLEALDDRLLLSSVPTAMIQDRVLFVVGTDQNDEIDVTIRPFRLGAQTIPVVRVAGIPRWFPSTRFDLVAVNAKAGDDLVTIHDRGLPLISVWIDGGEGNDTLLGSSANDTIIGGAGNDVIEGRGLADVIDGGPGWNVINGVPAALPASGDPFDSNFSSHQGYGHASQFPLSDSSPSSIALTLDEWAIVSMTNQARAQVGLPSLMVSESLQQASRIQAESMARLNRIAHVLPESETPTLADRARVVGYVFSALAENLAFNYLSASDAVEGWLGSDGHRRNLLSSEYTEIGVAIARNAMGQPYYVQVFGRPAA
ncbi:CAP domain-containing protein [Tautonia rosea]|uniref:CAP domain-containing protein n=1 Tax=Tautonia rosea TaxID=2728037 RepID=UPI0014763E0A|nr:CAP domain-containing protein [Tautonia rosea]